MRKGKVLLVDDEVAFTKNLSMLLEKRGYDTCVANSGERAIEIVSERDFDVVLLDLKMPGMDGIETLKKIKHQKPHIEVIILTGHGSVNTAIMGVNHGAYDYAMKPFDLDDLTDRIAKAFQRRLIWEQKVGRED